MENTGSRQRERVKTHLPSFGLGVFASTVVFLLIAATLFAVWRIRTSQLSIESPTINWEEIMEADAGRLWALVPNVSNKEMTGLGGKESADRKWVLSTNGAGLRGPAITAKENRYRILAIGDSTTFGLGANDNETWPAILQEIFDTSRSSVDVINAGTPGASLLQSMMYLKNEGLALAPDAVILTCGFNDRTLSAVKETERFRGGGKGLSGSTPEASTQPRLLPNEYLDLLSKTIRLCTDNGIVPFVMLWPERADLLLGQGDSSYASLTSFGSVYSGAYPIDLWPPFSVAVSDVYFDEIHVTPIGNRIAAEAVAHVLVYKTNLRTTKALEPNALNQRALEAFQKAFSKVRSPFLRNGILSQSEPLLQIPDADTTLSLFDYAFGRMSALQQLHAAYEDYLKANIPVAQRPENARKLTLEYPDSFNCWMIYGRCLRDAGEVQPACEAFRKALAINANDLSARLDLGGLFERMKDYVSASEMYRSALVIAPHDKYIQGLLEESLKMESAAGTPGNEESGSK